MSDAFHDTVAQAIGTFGVLRLGSRGNYTVSDVDARGPWRCDLRHSHATSPTIRLNIRLGYAS